jgi:hypothetical protein
MEERGAILLFCPDHHTGQLSLQIFIFQLTIAIFAFWHRALLKAE